MEKSELFGTRADSQPHARYFHTIGLRTLKFRSVSQCLCGRFTLLRVELHCIGADTCSWTRTHLPSCLPKTNVQRKLPISCFPDFRVASSFTVAAPQ